MKSWKADLLMGVVAVFMLAILFACGGEVTPQPGPTPTPKPGCAYIGTPGLAEHMYSWAPTTGLQTPSAAQTLACPSKTTTYTLTATTKCGKASSQVTVRVKKVVDGKLVEVTN